MEIVKQIESQRVFFSNGATKPHIFRLNMLRKLKIAIKNSEEQIMEALWKDLKKSEFESYATEINIILGELDYAIKNLKKWMRDERKSTPLLFFPSTSKIVRDPYGVVLIIAPWNYPFQLIMSPLIGAIAGGNCVVLRPSAAATHTSDILSKIIANTFDSQYISLIGGENEVTNIILKQHFDYIFYTGGVSYGKEVMRMAAENLTPVTLELGGKSPCVVDKDANLAIAARRIVWGKFLNCGQTCVAPDYLMVQNEVKQKFIDCLKNEIVRQFGTDVKSNPDYPRIINRSRFARLKYLMTQGEIIYGGESAEDECFIAPTLMINIDSESDIVKEEIFGPILPIIGFDELEEAIDRVNKNEKPLALYYFTESRAKAKIMIDNTSSGGACINDVVIQVANKNVPFGGVGNSGIGGYHGRYSFETFTHSRSVMTTSTKINIGIKFAPYKNKIKLLRFWQ